MSLLLETRKHSQDPVRKEDSVNLFFAISEKDNRPYLLIANF